jgi:hypothetical protein
MKAMSNADGARNPAGAASQGVRVQSPSAWYRGGGALPSKIVLER